MFVYSKLIKVLNSLFQAIQRKFKHTEKIFEEYYREEKSQEGFGLGLNLVKRICDEEGIIIKVDSDEEDYLFYLYF